MSKEILPALPPSSTAVAGGVGRVTVSTHGASIELPALIGDAGDHAVSSSFEFFTARIPNRHTREAYLRAVLRFAAWCESGSLPLSAVRSVNVAAYLEQLGADGMSVPSIKQHFAGLRHWLDWLTLKGVLDVNPAAAVRGPRYARVEGNTPALEASEAKHLFDALTGTDLATLRDRALLSVMLFNVPRVSAVVGMRVKDFDDSGDGWLLLHEKRNKERRLPAHHQVREALRAYLTASGLDDPAKSDGGKAALFQGIPARTGKLSGAAMHRNDAWAMVKRRCALAGLSTAFRTHSFRTTGANLHLQNGGKLEDLQELMGHADIRVTRGYLRGNGGTKRQEVERIHW
jgi:site-specific recombinase XerD